jgi:hypothetical protein
MPLYSRITSDSIDLSVPAVPACIAQGALLPARFGLQEGKATA